MGLEILCRWRTLGDYSKKRDSYCPHQRKIARLHQAMASRGSDALVPPGSLGQISNRQARQYNAERAISMQHNGPVKTYRTSECKLGLLHDRLLGYQSGSNRQRTFSNHVCVRQCLRMKAAFHSNCPAKRERAKLKTTAPENLRVELPNSWSPWTSGCIG